MNYSKAIRIIRASKGLTQTELADLISVNSSYISKIESGERVPSLKKLQLISDKLSIPFHLLSLLASSSKDITKLPKEYLNKVSNSLLNILLTSQKEFNPNGSNLDS